MKNKRIFISYSHADEKWKNLLVKQLKVLELEGLYQVWEDRQIQVGDDWLQKINHALNEADAAVLMISVDFLNSEFIRGKEVPAILENREKKGASRHSVDR